MTWKNIKIAIERAKSVVEIQSFHEMCSMVFLSQRIVYVKLLSRCIFSEIEQSNGYQYPLDSSPIVSE